MNRRPAGFRCGVLLLTLALAGAAQAAETPGARAAFAAGTQAFQATNFPAAHSNFMAAAAAAPAEKLDPAAAYYNAALAAYGAGDFKGAADSFARAASGADLALQARAYYNRGNALFHQVNAQSAAPATANFSTQELATASAGIGEAIQMYESAMALDPRDLDTKANYELAVLKQQELQQLQQQQQQQQQDQQNQQDQQDQQNRPNQAQDQPGDQQPQPQPQPEEQKDQQQEQPQAAQEQSDQNADENNQPQAAEKTSDTMTPEEAAMLLDAMKAQEQQQRDQLHPFLGRPVPVEKDW